MRRLQSHTWENFLRDVGGKFAGDHRAFTYFVPLAWFLSMVGYDYAGDTWAFIARMLANAIAFATCYGILFGMRRTLFRDRERRTIPAVRVVAAGFTLGATKVVITLILTASLTGNWSYLTDGAIKVSAGALTGAWYLPLAAVIMATQDRYRTAREVAYAQRLQQSTNSAGLRVIDPAHLKLADMLTQLRQIIDAQSDQPLVLAKSLSTMLDKKIRPFSRDLWSKSGRKISDRSAFELVGIVLSRTTFWPSLTSTAIMTVGAPLIVSTTGWLEGIGRLAVLGLCAQGALTALHYARPKNAPLGAIIFAVGAVTFAGVNETVVYFLFGQFGDLTPLSDIVLNAGLFVILSMLLGILRFTMDDLPELEREIGNIFDDDYFVGRLDLERLRVRQRELAHVIHGRLQNHILGAVLALTKDPQSPSPTDLLQEIDRLELAITDPEGLPQFHTSALIAEEFASLATRWRGIIDVSISSDLPTSMRADQVSACVSVAEEGITNAVRHGIASTVDIALHHESEHWVLSVSDNGVGPRNGPPGLGTLTLTHIAGNSWSLSTNSSGIGSVLTARIPATPTV